MLDTLNPFERMLTFIGSRRLVTFRRLPERQTGEFVARKKTIFRGGKHADDLNVFRKKVVYPSRSITITLTLISTLKASYAANRKPIVLAIPQDTQGVSPLSPCKSAVNLDYRNSRRNPAYLNHQLTYAISTSLARALDTH
jgi:hypothetical protein